MDVAFTQEASHEVDGKISAIGGLKHELIKYFEEKEYGGDLLVLYIQVVCISPKFEQFFKGKKPKYITQGKVYNRHGVQLISQSMTLSYDLKLDYEKYMNAEDIRPLFAEEVLNSLEVIKTIKKIKDFNYDAFRRDFEAFFWQVGWLS